MTMQALRLKPGIFSDTVQSGAEAAWTRSDKIRWRQADDGGAFPEKLGGWSKYYGFPSPGTPRALHPWADLAKTARLGIAHTLGVDYVQQPAGLAGTVTPQYVSTSPAASFTTTVGSATVQVNETGSNALAGDVLYVNTPVAVGGLVIFGAYVVQAQISANAFTILAASLATAAVTGGTVLSFTTVNASAQVTVNLTGHGLLVGDTAAFTIPTTVNGLVITGLYTVQSVPSANAYVIYAATAASSAGTVSMNGGNAAYVRYLSLAPGIAAAGYSSGGYSIGGYSVGSGTGAARTGTAYVAADWTLANFGGYLIAAPDGGPVTYWDPQGPYTTLIPIPNGPRVCTGAIVVMPQQMVMAYGADVKGVQDPLLVRWCDAGNLNTWTASTSNLAGSYRLTSGNAIVGGMQGPTQTLFWTDSSLWSAQFVGYPYVWGFNEIGTGCGLVGKHAAAKIGSAVYWMSDNQFMRLSGNGIEVLDCSVWDYCFQGINRTQLGKVVCAANSNFNEVTWYFPATGQTENTRYVKFNTKLGLWDYGTLERSAWCDKSVLGLPIGASPSTKYCYQHETAADDDGAAMLPYLETGYFRLNNGQDKMFMDRVAPSMQFTTLNGSGSAAMRMTVGTREWPNSPDVSTAYPFDSATTNLPTRVRGRLFKLRFESSDIGSWWRMGPMLYRAQPDGRQ